MPRMKIIARTTNDRLYSSLVEEIPQEDFDLFIDILQNNWRDNEVLRITDEDGHIFIPWDTLSAVRVQIIEE